MENEKCMCGCCEKCKTDNMSNEMCCTGCCKKCPFSKILIPIIITIIVLCIGYCLGKSNNNICSNFRSQQKCPMVNFGNFQETKRPFSDSANINIETENPDQNTQ
jgi:hypothetical protein